MKEKIKGVLAGLIFRMIALLTMGKISPIISACIIIEREGKFLLLERTDGLGYTVPGGIVRYNETVEACVLREAYEETGYRVSVQGFVGVYSSLKRDPRFRAIALVYRGEIVDGVEHNSNEGQTCWRTMDEALGHMAFDCDDMLKDYVKNPRINNGGL